jgi:prepilin-type N-terminal cleavage/methylation domain-containing protein
MRAASPKRTSGYTLLELMVASVILAFGLTVVMRSFTAGLESMRLSEQRSIATILCQQRMAEIAGLATLQDGSDQGATAAPWDAFRWQSEIATLEAYTDLKHVQVSVLWKTPGGNYDSVTLTRILRVPPEENTESATSEAGNA